LQQGAVSSWLAAHVPAGSILIDPFGASPHLVVEAARAGYRVIVAANNPISHFLIELVAMPPSAEDLQAALAELAATRRGEERLEPHILDLYATTCETCGAGITAKSFLWEAGADAPYAKETDCSQCGTSGEFPANDQDKLNARKFSGGGPNRARALERVAPIDSDVRPFAEEALNAYPPRAVYALFTLLNKLSGLTLPPNQINHLTALMLAACDRASSLWPAREKRRRPLQLTTPPRYHEHNIWLALETAIPLWATRQEAVPINLWPEMPIVGGISLYDGRFRGLAEELGDVSIAASISALPRPNQAYWTLSALWAGWLWGREAIGPFTLVLKRQRYDWAWHTTALHRTLHYLSGRLKPGLPVFGLITEAEPGFDAAAIIAAELSELRLVSIAARPGQHQTQILWRKAPRPEPKEKPEENPPAFSTSAQTLLSLRGEPANYHLMQNAALSGWAHSPAQPDDETTAASLFAQVRDQLNVSFRYQDGFRRFGGSDKDPTIGQWWLRDEVDLQEPISDRAEKFIVSRLAAEPGLSRVNLDNALCTEFPGLQTPSSAMTERILVSYAAETDGQLTLKDSDQPKARRADIAEMQAHLSKLGGQLGFKVNGDGPIIWQKGSQVLTFVVIASAVLDEPLRMAVPESERYIVLPGGRSRLVLDKFSANPRLAELAVDWSFIKYRLLRRMVENSELDLDLFKQQVAIDPLSEQNTQLPLL
jgi:hypothetical protein